MINLYEKLTNNLGETSDIFFPDIFNNLGEAVEFAQSHLRGLNLHTNFGDQIKKREIYLVKEDGEEHLIGGFSVNILVGENII